MSCISLCHNKRTIVRWLISRNSRPVLLLLSSSGQNGVRITPERLVSLPTAIIGSVLAFFAVSFEVRSRGAAWQDATRSHPIPTTNLAMSDRVFQIVWHQTPL